MGIYLKDVFIDKNGINLEKTNLENIIEKVFDIDQTINENIQEEISPLKQLSLQYIDNLKQVLKEIQIMLIRYQRLQNSLKRLGKEDDFYAQEYAKIKQDISTSFNFKNVYQDLIAITDIYTAMIQKTLNKNYQIIYVYQSRAANVVQVYKINDIEDLIKIRKTSSGGIEQRLTATKTKLEELDTRLKKEEYTIGLEQAILLDKTYKEIIRRYNIRKDPHLILWNIGTPSNHMWHMMKLYQKGDLGEAYAGFALNHYGSPFVGNINNPPETDIENFMLQVEKVDATFGGVQGDIYNEKNNTEYAVKTLQAAPQGIMQTIQMAQDIIQGNFNKENFEKYKEQMKKKGRNTIQVMTIGEVEMGLKEVYQKI